MKASGVGAAAVAKDAKALRPKQNIRDFLESKKAQIAQMLPKHINPDRFMRILLNVIYNNPKIARCTFESVLYSVRQAASCGLEPGGFLGLAALVPYFNKGAQRFECQFQAMYRGLVQLSYNTGQFKIIDAEPVHEKDFFDYELGSDAKLVHRPAEGERGEIVKYYAFFVLKTGGMKPAVMTKAEVVKWAERYSKSYESADSPWKNFFDAMALKTVLRKVLKLAPVSIELPPDNDDRDIGIRYTALEPDTIPGTAELMPEAEAEPPAAEGEKPPENAPPGEAKEKELDIY